MAIDLKSHFTSIWKTLCVGFLSLACYPTPLFSLIEECDSSFFAVKAEYIYFQPLSDNTFLPMPTSNEQNPFTLQADATGEKNKSGYASGLRLNLLYTNSNACHLIQNGCLRLTYLPAHHVKKVSLESLLSELIAAQEQSVDFEADFSGFLNSDQNLDYYASDLWTTFSLFYMTA